MENIINITLRMEKNKEESSKKKVKKEPGESYFARAFFGRNKKRNTIKDKKSPNDNGDFIGIGKELS